VLQYSGAVQVHEFHEGPDMQYKMQIIDYGIYVWLETEECLLFIGLVVVAEAGRM
jgi:hypothetical protein